MYFVLTLIVFSDQYMITYSTRSFPHHKHTTAYETKTRCACHKNMYCYLRHRPAGLKGSSCNVHRQQCATAASSSHRFYCTNETTPSETLMWEKSGVHSVEQKSIGLKFSKSWTGSDVRYSCHHNSSCFTFP